jgi:hypothetical protein
MYDCGHADTVVKANEYSSVEAKNRADDQAEAQAEEVPKDYKLLLQDVSICEYYLQAKAYAERGEDQERERIFEDNNRCFRCFQKWHSCSC